MRFFNRVNLVLLVSFANPLLASDAYPPRPEASARVFGVQQIASAQIPTNIPLPQLNFGAYIEFVDDFVLPADETGGPMHADGLKIGRNAASSTPMLRLFVRNGFLHSTGRYYSDKPIFQCVLAIPAEYFSDHVIPAGHRVAMEDIHCSLQFQLAIDVREFLATMATLPIVLRTQALIPAKHPRDLTSYASLPDATLEGYVKDSGPERLMQFADGGIGKCRVVFYAKLKDKWHGRTEGWSSVAVGTHARLLIDHVSAAKHTGKSKSDAMKDILKELRKALAEGQCNL